MNTLGFAMPSTMLTATPSGQLGVSSSVLKDVKKKCHSTKTKEFIDNVLLYRELQKDLKTYYVGYSDLTWPDSKIHCTLNHVSTDTGRLSCSKPNLQNATQVEDY